MNPACLTNFCNTHAEIVISVRLIRIATIQKRRQCGCVPGETPISISSGKCPTTGWCKYQIYLAIIFVIMFFSFVSGAPGEVVFFINFWTNKYFSDELPFASCSSKFAITSNGNKYCSNSSFRKNSRPNHCWGTHRPV